MLLRVGRGTREDRGTVALTHSVCSDANTNAIKQLRLAPQLFDMLENGDNIKIFQQYSSEEVTIMDAVLVMLFIIISILFIGTLIMGVKHSWIPFGLMLADVLVVLCIIEKPKKTKPNEKGDNS
jgi:hypothetical protein